MSIRSDKRHTSLRLTLHPPLSRSQSAFLELLFKNNCIRTQKKQKVFYWYSVQHDKLFLDALERDTRREKQGLEASSVPVAEPAMSFSYDPAMPLLQHFKEGNNAAIAAAAAITASAALASSAAVTSAGGSSSSAYCGSSGKFQSHLSAGNGVEQSNIDGIPSPSDLNSREVKMPMLPLTRLMTPFPSEQQQRH